MEECISDIQCNVALNCPGNQQYSTCHGCTVPCSDRDSPEPCPRICQIGCYCPPGTYLLGEQCVSRQQCETAQSCPGNQIYSTCAGCDVTCSQRNDTIACAAVYTPTIFVSVMNNVMFAVAEDCPGNQVYSLCASCDVTCSQRNETIACAAVCRQQCTCPPNTYLQGDLCLTNEQCDAAAACPNNQVYSLCAGCDVSCADRNNPGPCTLQCRQQCTCPSGTYLYMEECISDVQCNVALNCPGNQQYSTCHGCTVPCSDRDSPEPCPSLSNWLLLSSWNIFTWRTMCF
ncbi:otogelin-like [Ciona intestinalis]